MLAYPDSRCTFGYMTVCPTCKPLAPPHVDTSRPLVNPPAVGKRQPCEICKRQFALQSPEPHNA